MFHPVMLSLVVNLLVALHGIAALQPITGHPGVDEDFHWRARLCCERPSNDPRLQGEDSEARTRFTVQNKSQISGFSQYQCHIQNSLNDTDGSGESQTFSANCLDILCWLDDKQENVICYFKHQRAPATTTSQFTVELQRLVMGLGAETNHSAPVQCSGEDEITCSIALNDTDDSVLLLVSGSIDGHSLLSPQMHFSSRELCRPDPPFNLQYNVTTEGEVMFTWNDPQTRRYPLTYEIRYSSNISLQHWEVLKVHHPWVSLTGLSSGVRYIIQVRFQNIPGTCRSEWSQPFHLTLDVSYTPAEVFTRPGAEVTVYGVFHNCSWNASRAVWVLNGQTIPESQYRVVNGQVSAVTIRSKEPGLDTLMCCHPWGERLKCSIAYAKVYTEGFFDANITCRTDQSRTDSMTCKWNKSAWAVVRLLYRRYNRMCEELSREEDPVSQSLGESMVGVEECPDGAGDFRECTLRSLNIFSCYKLWLVVEGGHGKVRSLPVFVAPINYVQPSPPFDLEAVTLPNRTLSVRWRRPHLPAYDLQYELRYVASRGMAESQWKVFGPIYETLAAVLVQDPCIQYKVEVRCRRSTGSGYWSDWSESRVSSVYSSKAPETGPDFWRVLQEDAGKNNTNVTLLFKPVPAEDPASCVQALIVLHQASGGTVWRHDILLGSFYTFQWREEVHTVTVMSRNSIGSSGKNMNMTLVRRPKQQCVRSFRAALNSTCVTLSWSLLSDQPAPLSFVVEWSELSEDPGQSRTPTGRVEWLRVPATSRELQLCRHFFGTEEFRLYPVFGDGEGGPIRCIAERSDPAAFMLLMIIAFLSIVMFVTLVISQNQMRKLMWKDVPNPNNCSWAKGMDFKKLDGTDNLFGHPEGLSACPLLLVSENICEVEIVEKPHLLVLDKGQEEQVLLDPSVDPESGNTNLPTTEGSLEPLSLDTSTVTATPETSGQSSVTYSTVLVFDQPVLVRKQQESLSSSSDEGNFSANNSDISGSFPGGLWELENPSCSDDPNPRNSCSYNSVEEYSETSEQEDEASESRRLTNELYYLGMNEEDEEDEEDFDEEETTEVEVCTDGRSACVDSSPPSERKDSTDSDSSFMSQGSVPLYLPQFRTANIKPLSETVGDSAPKL